MPVGGRCRVCDLKGCREDHEQWPCTRCGLWKARDEFGVVFRSGKHPRRTAQCVECLRLRPSQFQRTDRLGNPSLSLKARYGITLELYNEILERQGGRCAICRQLPSHQLRNFDVDHDHKCCPGKKSCGRCVRGLLCRACNVGLGHFRDDFALLARAIEYLKGDDQD